MLINELEVGADITLAIIWGEFHYDIPAKVAHVTDNGVWTNSFTYAGQTLDFQSTVFRTAVIDLYANDAAGKRRGWKNISVEIKRLKGKDYYELRPNAFKKFAAVTERRENNRMPLNANCTISVDPEDTIFHGVLRDVSSNGLSFFCEKDLKADGKRILVEFEDKVRDHKFQLLFSCRSVRMIKEKDTYLYGCVITVADRNALEYLYLKNAEMHAKLKEKDKDENA